MSIASTKILYIGALLLAVLFMYFSQRRKKQLNIWNIFAIAVLGLLVGFRHQTVGYDTHAYYAINSVLQSNSISELYNLYGVDEVGYLWISYVFVQIFNSVQAPFIFWGIFTNSLVVFRLHELKDKISMPIAIMSFFTAFYFAEFNIMREMIAVAIIFYGSRWIEKKQYMKYGCACILAALIHFTALIALSIIPITILLNWKRLTYKQRSWNILFLCAVLIAFVFVVFQFWGQYGHYLTSDLMASGIGVVIPAKIIIGFVLCVSSKRKKTQIQAMVDLDWIYFVKVSTWLYFIGLIGYFMSYFIAYADRAAMYFYVFELICYGAWYKKFKRNDLYKLLIVAMILLPLLLSLLSGNPSGQGEYPYVPYWD